MSAPRVYVGTYRRYNEGSLHGAWLDLEDYADADAFWQAVNELHAAEIKAHGEIEPMFQDWEDIPSRFISESHLSPDVWEQWVELDEDDRELLEVYLDEVDSSGDLGKAQEAFLGKFDSEADWAEDYWDSCGLLESIPENLRFYIDYEKYARDARLGGDVSFVRKDGDVWVFSNH